MEKVIIIVEDRVFSIRELLFNTQTVLFLGSKNRLNNAVIDNDTQICVLNVLWDKDGKVYWEDEKSEFQEFKRELEKRQNNLKKDNNDIPAMNYAYESILLNEKAYNEKRIEYAKKIYRMIETIRGEKKCVILLDLVLNDRKDTDMVLNGDTDSNVLSQILYKMISDCAIPYTTYEESSKKFRDKWAEGVDLNRKILERKVICGNKVNKEFEENINKILGIGETNNE